MSLTDLYTAMPELGRLPAGKPATGHVETIKKGALSAFQSYATSGAELVLEDAPLVQRRNLLRERFKEPPPDLKAIEDEYKPKISEAMGTVIPGMGGVHERVSAIKKEYYEKVDGWILNARKIDPERMQGIDTYAEIRQRRIDAALRAEQEFADVYARNPSSLKWLSAGVGMMGGVMADPPNAAMMAAGAPRLDLKALKGFGAARAILKAAAIDGSINAATEIASTPSIAEWQKALGKRYGFGEAAENVALAFGVGGVFSGSVRAIPLAGRIPNAVGSAFRRGSPSLEPLGHIGDAASLKASTRDAAKFLEREAHIDEAAPPGSIRSDDDLILHRQNVEAAAKSFEAYAPAKLEFGEVPVVTPRGMEINVKEEIVELSEVISSDMKGYDATIQPRDRVGRVQSEARINEIAARLDPMQLGFSRVTDTGAPIVGPDRMVESGNGRVMALRRVYQKGGDNLDKYKNFLKATGKNIEGFKEPVLIRTRTTRLSDTERREFVVQSNEAVADRMSAPERAKADAGLLDDTVFALFEGGDVGAAGNSRFRRAFAEKVVAPAERGAFITATGELSQEGARRVKGAMLARAYGDNDLIASLLDDVDNDIKGIGNVLMDMAGEWAKFRASVAKGEIPPWLDVNRALLDAVKQVQTARTQGRPIADFIDQGSMFAEQALSREAGLMLRAMYSPDLSRAIGMAKFKAFLAKYVAEASKADASPGLLTEPPPQARHVLKRALIAEHGAEAVDKFWKPKWNEAGPMHPRKDLTLDDAEKYVSDNFSPTNLRPDYNSLERIALREKIADELYNQGAGVKGKSVVIVTGPPGSGKSSAVVNRLKNDGYLEIDADAAKEKLPEFDDGMGANNIHVESNKIIEIVMKKATSSGDNIALPIVGSKPDKVLRFIDEFKKMGYTIDVIGVIIPADQSWARAAQRYGDAGRYVPKKVVLDYGDGPRKTFDQLKADERLRSAVLYDNNVPYGTQPRILEKVGENVYAGALGGDGGRGGIDPDPGRGTIIEGIPVPAGKGIGSDSQVDDFMDLAPAERVRIEPLPDKYTPDITPEKLATAEAELKALVAEMGDDVIALEDGRTVSVREFANEIQGKKRIIEAMTTCRVA